MGAARIIVYFQGELVEDRVLQVRRPISVGDGPDAKVSFPGWNLTLAPWMNGISVDGEELLYGCLQEMSWEGIRVCIEAVRREELPREPLWNTDVRFPVLMFAVFLLLLSVDSANQAISAQVAQHPLSVAGWTFTSLKEEPAKPSANPDFDLESVGRYGVLQDRVIVPKVLEL